jgi:ABC-type branched-subunit amino acid transport system substrate-binding protein
VKTLGKKLLSLTFVCVLIALGMFGCGTPAVAPTAEPTAVAPAPADTLVPVADVATTVPATATPKDLLIGDIETLSGASSDNLKLAASGSYLAQQYINKHGGITINGEVYMVKIILEDNKGTADGAQAAANKLIQQDHVMFVTGSGRCAVCISL